MGVKSDFSLAFPVPGEYNGNMLIFQFVDHRIENVKWKIENYGVGSPHIIIIFENTFLFNFQFSIFN